MEEEPRTDEDKIIEILRIEGMVRQYEDLDFLPVRQSLYEEEDVMGVYDEEIAPAMAWCRPTEIDAYSQYFSEDIELPRVINGTLPDDTFISALMSVCAFNNYDLLETIIASRPDDFQPFGVLSCRFYVEGDWVEVITDTRIPSVRHELTHDFTPAYSRSPVSNEMWIALVEKAYAKAVGSYEAIQKIQLHEALLHLTGGSVQQYTTAKVPEGPSPWNLLVAAFGWGDSIILATPLQTDTTDIDDNGVQPTTTTTAATENNNEDKDTSGNEAGVDGVANMDDVGAGPETKEDPAVVSPEEKAAGGVDEDVDMMSEDEDEGSSNFNGAQNTIQTASQMKINSNRSYTVLSYLESSAFKLVCVYDPWGELEWTGVWSNNSTKWEDFPDMLSIAEDDLKARWNRDQPKGGAVWMPFEQFQAIFGTFTFCKLFPNEKFKYYCVKDTWPNPEVTQCGPLSTVQHMDKAISQAAASRQESIIRATPQYCIDCDPSWFNNPQCRISSEMKSKVFISVVPFSSEGDFAPIPNITVVATSKRANSTHIWDCSVSKIVSTDKHVSASAKFQGQEASLWGLEMDPKMNYHIIPACGKRSSYGPFVVRVFCHDFVTVERMGPVHRQLLNAQWKRGAEHDTAGGPVSTLDKEKGGGAKKENSKWCQNPQFHIDLKDKFSRKEVHLKLVVRRTDKVPKPPKGQPPETISFVVCKAEALEDQSPLRKKGGQPRQNALGEVIPSKKSSLKKKYKKEEATPLSQRDDGKTILRLDSVPKEAFNVKTTGNSKTEACLYFPGLPRSWLSNGLILIPSISEIGKKGTFDFEVFSSEPVEVKQLPELYMKSIAGEWTDALSGGSHLCEKFKKNPKFFMKLVTFDPARAPVKMRLTLSRYGSSWTNTIRHDAVGSMIGFYIFRTNQGDQELMYEGAFVPDREVSTPSDFTLEPLDEEEDYIVLCTTFTEGQLGNFVLSVSADCEVALTRGDAGR